MHSSAQLTGVAALCLVTASVRLSAAQGHLIRFAEPAGRWTEALPVGNGHLGAMVFGNPAAERIQINEDSIWAGPPVPENGDNLAPKLAEIRQLFFDGHPAEGEGRVAREILGPRISPRSYQPLGDLWIRHRDPETTDPADSASARAGYTRELDLQTGLARTQYRHQGREIRRTTFASAPDDVLVTRIETDEPGSLDLEIALTRAADFVTQAPSHDALSIRGQAQHGGQHLGVHWLGWLRALPEGGSVEAVEDRLLVRGATALTLLVAAKTDYNFHDPARPLPLDLASWCRRVVNAAAERPYDELETRAVADHRALFDRCVLDLGDTDPELAARPTPARLAALREGANDPDLIETYFQFGRYLLIGSSRPGSLPANLQGLWNEALEAPWNADYHININLQMNYWPAEVTGLPELHEPFFRLLSGLQNDGQVLARRLGCRGFAASHTTDAWQWAALIGAPGYGMWPLGAAWSTAHAMEHYRFTGDREFLRQVGYPLLKGSAEFLLDWLTTDPRTGRLVSGPTTSPENSYRFEGHRLTLAMGNAMDQMIVWENFTNALEAAAVLGIEDAFTAEVRRALANLALPRIGSDGRILEWSEAYEEAEPGHRHMSHLYGLHPGFQFTPRETPEFAAAARKVLEGRLAQGGGHTGWSRAWIINFYARLLDGEKVHENLLALLTKSTLPNLFDTHPPFQIDGNFGGCAGIAEALLQSHGREPVIRPLPALPSAWPDGQVSGLRARGGFVIAMSWHAGSLTALSVESLLGNPCRLALGEREIAFDTAPGKTYRLDRLLQAQP